MVVAKVGYSKEMIRKRKVDLFSVVFDVLSQSYDVVPSSIHRVMRTKTQLLWGLISSARFVTVSRCRDVFTYNPDSPFPIEVKVRV